MQSTGEVRLRYADEAPRYDRRWRMYLRETIGATLEMLPPAVSDRVLDVGCGTGLLLEEVRTRRPGTAAWGADASPEMLAIARRRLPPGVPLVAADVHFLPFQTGSFELTISTSSLHHWSDPPSALAELARVTRPGGHLVLTDWSDDHLPLRLFSRVLRVFDHSHHRSYRAVEAQRRVEAAGFAVDTVRFFRVGWLWGMMTISARRLG